MFFAGRGGRIDSFSVCFSMAMFYIPRRLITVEDEIYKFKQMTVPMPDSLTVPPSVPEQSAAVVK